jgi:hypothetical protein
MKKKDSQNGKIMMMAAISKDKKQKGLLHDNPFLLNTLPL